MDRNATHEIETVTRAIHTHCEHSCIHRHHTRSCRCNISVAQLVCGICRIFTRIAVAKTYLPRKAHLMHRQIPLLSRANLIFYIVMLILLLYYPHLLSCECLFADIFPDYNTDIHFQALPLSHPDLLSDQSNIFLL